MNQILKLELLIYISTSAIHQNECRQWTIGIKSLPLFYTLTSIAIKIQLSKHSGFFPSSIFIHFKEKLCHNILVNILNVNVSWIVSMIPSIEFVLVNILAIANNFFTQQRKENFQLYCTNNNPTKLYVKRSAQFLESFFFYCEIPHTILAAANSIITLCFNYVNEKPMNDDGRFSFSFQNSSIANVPLVSALLVYASVSVRGTIDKFHKIVYDDMNFGEPTQKLNKKNLVWAFHFCSFALFQEWYTWFSVVTKSKMASRAKKSDEKWNSDWIVEKKGKWNEKYSVELHFWLSFDIFFQMWFRTTVVRYNLK